ncbi:MAG: TadE/TadG family type IV pilus assembly protein, partial [Anaerolineales bacterium]
MALSPPNKAVRSRRGQTLVEFALTLPILLILVFGIIEFARIFQSWVTLQNSARVAVRAGITGDWEPESVIDRMANPSSIGDPENKDSVLAHWIPCETNGTNARFRQHWGIECDPESDDHDGLRNDMARLMWIADNARNGAAGLNLAAGEHIVGLHDDQGNEIQSYPTELNYDAANVQSDEPGWFHVWICSGRPPLIADSNTVAQRYQVPADRSDRTCTLLEDAHGGGTAFGPPSGANQYDAGGPGDVLEVVVFYNHPLITPLGLAEHLPLMARRVGVNEAFRATRAVNLPPQLLTSPNLEESPSTTPEDTVDPSAEPTDPTEEAPPTEPTEPPTPEPTDPPVCTDVSIVPGSVIIFANRLRLEIEYTNPDNAPFYLTGANIDWRPLVIHPGMQIDEMSMWINGSNRTHWEGPSRNDPLVVNASNAQGGTWFSDPNRRLIQPGQTLWEAQFSNFGTDSFDIEGYTVEDFYGSSLFFGYPGIPAECEIEFPVDEPGPTPAPSDTPTPTCSD